MKILSALIIVLVLYSCGRNNSPYPESSQWTFKGVNYRPDTTTFHDNSLEAEDSFENSISVTFLKKPVTGRIYKVVPFYYYRDSTTNTCSIWIHDPKMGVGGYFAVGKPGDEVNISIKNGKIVASFANISLQCLDTGIKEIETVSGALIEE